ncbi:DUF6364 family protein [Dyadobacter pollutisoli]|jgi:hypothetical protein|uniref:DUF6364 family protein n=1 Tax=Dyadobacter pollutisoli TaxID=2910158 RepID=A0A9E8SNU0_9BACT|nr:DUF6364 family protein [Dyadobacter pollutisoli]WAC11132.1 DUF6364 family protein [Dyadobacter pollutisoli]
MKSRLNLTIESTVLLLVKEYAAAHHVSVSQIVEDYLKSIVKPPLEKSNIFDMVHQLHASMEISHSEDLKKDFYEDQSQKYDF